MTSRPHGASPVTVSETVDDLILDLLEWIGPGERPYMETMEAWRTSCPRLPVWEDATDLGFIERHHEPGRGALVSVSATGVEHLRKHRQAIRV
jgi:D-3-phosphoglycerate dehydrogenase